MYIYIYVCMYLCTYAQACMHLYMHVNMYVCQHIRIHILGFDVDEKPAWRQGTRCNCLGGLRSNVTSEEADLDMDMGFVDPMKDVQEGAST